MLCYNIRTTNIFKHNPKNYCFYNIKETYVTSFKKTIKLLQTLIEFSRFIYVTIFFYFS